MRTNERKLGNHSPDWARIEVEYVAGIKAVRAIARSFGVSDAGIRKHARKHNWVRSPASYVVGSPNCELAACPNCGAVLEVSLSPARKRLVAEPAP